MKIQGEHLGNRLRLPARTSHEGPSFIECEFDNCRIYGEGQAADDLPVITGASLEKCSVWSCDVGKLWLRGCTVVDTQWKRLMILDACVLEHVTFRGKLGSLNILSNAFDHSVDCSSAYEDIDWALDISEARFAGVSIRGIPSRAVRRDPASQVVITRKAVLEHPNWREIVKGTSLISIADMMRDGYEDIIFAAGLNSRSGKKDLEDIRHLRDIGIGEPD